MAEDESAKDTSNDDVDTSTNEDAQETDSDDSEEESLDDLMADEPNESDEESDEEAATDSDDDSEEESKDDVDEETKEEDTTSEVSAEEQRRRNDAYAKQRIAEKQKAKEEAQQEYLQSAEDDQDLALRQLQVDAYNNKIEFNQNKLQNGIDKAVAQIDIFSKGTPEEKEELLSALDEFEQHYVQYDQNGDPLNVKGDVYQYLSKKADSIRRLTSVGARQSLKQKNNAKTRTMATPSKAPREAKKDPDLAAFDEEANKW
jgi:hypothetical protein